MLRIVVVLAAPVHDARVPTRPPTFLCLHREWQRLEQAVKDTHAPILLARLVPPTLERLRRELSPRVAEQGLFPHVLHFSGHGRAGSLVLEDEYGQTHMVNAQLLLGALRLPRCLELVVLNACETADETSSTAKSLLEAKLARAVVGHPLPVRDEEAIAFARTLFTELTDGHRLAEAVTRAGQHITTHKVLLLGDGTLRFTGLVRGEPLVLDARPRGNLPPGDGVGFFGRGAELVNLARALDRPPCLALITGPAGIGKSRLALELAHRNAWRFPGGVAYAEAPRESATADYLLNSLAQALGLEVPSQERVVKALLEHLHAKATLLVLDNLEFLAEAELRRLAAVLERLGERSAAIATLRPPLPILEDISNAVRLPLLTGLSEEAASVYAFRLAEAKGLPLPDNEVAEIARATSGHPLLISRIVAQAQRRDRQALLAEVRRHEGDFAAQVEAAYTWSAERVNAAGQRAWRILPLFPAGWLPEAPLRSLAGAEGGAAALREAAVADFDPHLQGWRWHPTAAEYAANQWPLDEAERKRCLVASLPGWSEWLASLAKAQRFDADRRLEAALPNLEVLLSNATIFATAPFRQFLEALSGALPEPHFTLVLRGIQEPVYTLMAALATDDAERAKATRMLAGALFALGRPRDALETAQKAVGLCRTLVAQNGDFHKPELARSLNNMATFLIEMQQWFDAAVPAKEAVELFRVLAGKNPDAFNSDLAGSLNTLANASIKIARDLQMFALTKSREAVALYRQLDGRDPTQFRSELAGSLNNLAAFLSEAGRRVEALERAQEAVDMYRELAGQNPDAFNPDLAGSLNNLAIRLSEVGRQVQALEPAQEAVELYRALARQNPDAFNPDLARALAVMGQVREANGEPEAALACFRDGIEILTPAFQRLPQAHAPLMLGLLDSYFRVLANLGREPDPAGAEAFLNPVLEVLQRLKTAETDSASGPAGPG